MGLTEVDDNGNWKLKGVEWSQIKPGAVLTKKVWEKLYGALWKLKDYEETGLMPDKVLELNEETQEQARAMLERVAKLSDEIEQLKHGGDHGIKFSINKDGIADVYDDTYDIVIHCESAEDQADVKAALKKIPRWIPVTERLPEKLNKKYLVTLNDSKHDVITARYAMFEGAEKWLYPYTWSELEHVLAWMPLPEPYKEDE